MRVCMLCCNKKEGKEMIVRQEREEDSPGARGGNVCGDPPPRWEEGAKRVCPSARAG